MTTRTTVTGRLLNEATGEVTLDRFTMIPDDKRYGRRRDHTHDRSTGNATRYTTPYTIFFRPVFRLLALDDRVRSGDIRVLFLVCEQILPNQDTVSIDHTAIGTPLGITARTVSNSISRLVHVGVLTRPSRGKVGFNPVYIWCGGAGKREQLVSQEETP